MVDLVPVLASLGVEVISDDGKEIKGLCPVHELALGRPDTHPSWYMNAITGAWICFSCQSKGSLHSLVEVLGGDESLIERMPIESMKATVETWKATDEAPVEEIHVSERAFNRNPYPPSKVRDRKDIDLPTCELLNIRWNKEKRCFMLPTYSFDHQLMGWQEKSTGYFNNVPPGMKRSSSLFGYQGIVARSSVALVESPLDAARFYRYGMQACAICGSYTSAAQLEALSRVAEVVVLALDHDEAGHTGTAVASRMLSNLGVRVRFFAYDVGTEGQDPGELTADQLVDGFDNASSIAPGYIRAAVEESRKRPYKKSEEKDQMNEMRKWAAETRRSRA